MSISQFLDGDIETPAIMESVLAAVLTDAMREHPIDIATVETITETGGIPAPGLMVTTETGFTFEIAITRKDAREGDR